MPGGFFKNCTFLQRKESRYPALFPVLLDICIGINLSDLILIYFQFLFKQLCHFFCRCKAVLCIFFVQKNSKGLKLVISLFHFLQVYLKAAGRKKKVLSFFPASPDSADGIAVKVIDIHNLPPILKSNAENFKQNSPEYADAIEQTDDSQVFFCSPVGPAPHQDSYAGSCQKARHHLSGSQASSQIHLGNDH